MTLPPLKPDFVYKYRSLRGCAERHRLLRIIEASKIYYATPASFNDPFDCKVPSVELFDFDPYFVRYLIAAQTATDEESHAKVYETFLAPRSRLQAELDQLNADLSDAEKGQFKIFVEGIRRRVNKTGVLSFSAIGDNTLMWSHYAYNHTGVCLKFSLDRWPETKHRLLPVRYCIHRLFPKLDKQNFGDEQLVKAVVLTKDKLWYYEQEWRALRKAPGECCFPPDALVGIIFGCMTSNSDKALLRETVAGRKHIVLYQTEMKKGDFGLNIFSC